MLSNTITTRLYPRVSWRLSRIIQPARKISCSNCIVNSVPPTEAGTSITAVSAVDPKTDASLLDSILQKDGVVIVKSLVSESLCKQIREDLKPSFDTDRADAAAFFPSTTKRAIGVLGHSKACGRLALNGLFLSVANRILSSEYTYWEGQEQKTVVGKPQITSIVGFRVEPGGLQQPLHRDDADYHTRNCDMPVMLGCVTALTKTTKANGATIVIPKSHKWGPKRCPLDEEAIPGELDVGDAMMFVGNVYHAGGSNITTEDARETIGVFMCKGTLRQEENQYLEVPPEMAKQMQLSPQLLRLLGYGICPPALGLYRYKDPMESIFGVIDDETIRR